MAYSKPELAFLGQATDVVLGSKNNQPPENGDIHKKAPFPDADLDS